MRMMGEKYPTKPRLAILTSVASLIYVSCSLLLIQAPIEDVNSQRLVPMLPPPPANSLATHLAKSPASIQLASEFFASERQRAGNKLPGKQALEVAEAAQPLSSQEPEFSWAVPNFRLDQYHSLDEIYSFLEAIPKRFKQAQLFTIGQTSEGRPIKALELISNGSDPNYVWLDALTHAREWVTGSTILYIIDQLLLAGQQTAVGNQRNYLIVPVVNPDGYSYTWTNNRMWRKNRSRQVAAGQQNRIHAPGSAEMSNRGAGGCIGADLNRNFNHQSFGGEGASSDPCSHIYSGAYPLSEPETRAVADLMWSLRDRIKFYLTIHSYNQLWASPYAHTTEQSASYAKHMRVLRTIQRAVRETEGVQYEIGPLSTSLYVGSGFGIDFAYDKCGIEHSYLVELRDKGAHGFLLPADQIMPTARETYAGLRAGLQAAQAQDEQRGQKNFRLG